MIEAISTLLQMASTEGWQDVLLQGIDSVGIDQQPQRENSLYWSLFFVVFVIFGNFFIMNLFAGAVVMTFNKEKEILEKTYLLSDKQKKWLEQKRACLAIKPLSIHLKHQNKFRDQIRQIVINKYFSFVIFVTIILNTITLAITWYGEPKQVTLAVLVLNYIFSFVFIMETLMKIVGLGFTEFYKDKWNRFDFLVVSLSVIAEIAA